MKILARFTVFYLIGLFVCLYALFGVANAQSLPNCELTENGNSATNCLLATNKRPLIKFYDFNVQSAGTTFPLLYAARTNSTEEAESIVQQPNDMTPLTPFNYGKLAHITTPCTRDCADTCEVCVPLTNICAPEPVCYTNCQIQAGACWGLVDSYKGYFTGHVQNNISYYKLSPQVKNALAPYMQTVLDIPRSQLDEISVGTSGNAGEDNAMTDCDKITWTNSPDGNKIEQALRAANKNSSDILTDKKLVEWVYHEFVHTFQCNELGGRTEYAYRWFGSLGQGVLGEIARCTNPLTCNINPNSIHDQQPTEQNAEERGQWVYAKMPDIVPRYVMSMQSFPTQFSGTTLRFVSNARNVLTGDGTQFVIKNAKGEVIANESAHPVPGESTRFNSPLSYIDGNFAASWTIAESLAGQTLRYKFEILDNNGNLMDESSEQSFHVVKRFIYVDSAAATGGNGMADKPYKTIQAALNDPDIAVANGLRLKPGCYVVTETLSKNILIEVNGSGTITLSTSCPAIASSSEAKTDAESTNQIYLPVVIG